MRDWFIDIGIELFHLICVIILLSYFFFRTKLFKRYNNGEGTLKDTLLITLIFGFFSISGILSNIWLYGSESNVRNLGPIFAGLMFGPWIGFGASLIGATFRYSLGGLTVIPSTLSTLFVGIMAGLVWMLNKKRYIGALSAIIFVVFTELLHMGLVIFMLGDGPVVMSIIEKVWIPMFPLSLIGISIFSIVYDNFLKERKEHEELELRKVETRSATEIQRGFLPKNAPEIPGYDIFAGTYPAREVGGDFYDFIPLENGNLGVVIADVSGKSIPAAIFMALSCTTVRVQAQSVKSPHLAVEKVNSSITRYEENGMFFSMFYGEINTDKGEISYVNAGHPPPLLIRDNGTVEELKLTGPIIGFLDDTSYNEVIIGLCHGDIIICYTDGVTEAQQSDGKMFGKERLINTAQKMKSLSSEKISSEIIREINRFVADNIQFDDISLLIIKRTTPINS